MAQPRRPRDLLSRLGRLAGLVGFMGRGTRSLEAESSQELGRGGGWAEGEAEETGERTSLS